MKRLLCVLLIGCGSDTITVSEGGTDAGGMDASDDKSLDNYVPPMCGMSAWLTYGHDAKRTFATDACISGPLTVSWTYTPMPPAMKTVKAMHHVIAAPDAIYLQWAASAGQYIGTTAASTPASAISAGNGFVYLVEGAEFVARKQSDGMKAWSQAVTQPGAQAPVLANGLVIVGTQTGVSAFDAQSGSPKWQSPAPGAGAHAYTIDISNGCSGLQHLGAPIATSIAAAIPSGTLVVTADRIVGVVRLTPWRQSRAERSWSRRATACTFSGSRTERSSGRALFPARRTRFTIRCSWEISFTSWIHLQARLVDLERVS